MPPEPERDRSESSVGVGLIGLGTVGGGVAELLRDHAELYHHRFGKRIELRRALVRDVVKAGASKLVEADRITDDAEAFFGDTSIDVVIEVAGGGAAVEAMVRRSLEAGRHVVTANKSLLADKGAELFALARKHEVSIAFEASCGGGIPCVTGLTHGLMANRITGLYGILNGTCNFILTAMTRRGLSYDDALAEAQRLGYAEADPTLDVSGADAGQKLAILAALAFGIAIPKVRCVGVDGLSLEDLRFGQEMGYDVKLLGIAEQTAPGEPVSVGVEPCFIHERDLLAPVRGAFNALVVEGDAVGPVMFYGQGAGRGPTASAVVSDLLNVVSGGYPAAFAATSLTPDCGEAVELLPADKVRGRFFLRVQAVDRPGTLAKMTAILGEEGIGVRGMTQHETNHGQVVPVVFTTNTAPRGSVHRAAHRLADLDVVEGQPMMIRIVDAPEDA